MSGPAPTLATASLGHVERHLFLRAVLSGVEMGAAAAAAIASVITDAYFTDGTVIYREGESTDHLYFVVDGKVALSRAGEEPWLMEPRSVFGALDAALEQPHARTAVAVGDVHAMLLAVEDWQDVLEDHFELAQAVVLRNARSLYDMCLRLSPTGGFPEPAEPEPSPEQTPTAALRPDLDAVDRLVVLTESPLFERAGVQPLITLAQNTRAVQLKPREVLFERGEPVTELFMVANGIVEIERSEPEVRARFGRGALVAGPPALANTERAFTARAQGDAVVLAIRRDHLIDVMEDHFPAFRSVYAYLAVERDRMQRLEATLRASQERH